MNVRHLEQFQPVCPACRTADAAHRVTVTGVDKEAGQHIIEGRLSCTNEQCQHEYPIIDGVPLLLPALREYVANNYVAIVARDDLTAATESMIGDCCGPKSPLDHLRQHVSSYAWSHYGDADPAERDSADGHSIQAVLQAGWEAAGKVTGPLLDAGCAVGGTTFALAERTDDLVLGIDIHFSMLRVAARVLREGVVRYPRRRGGIVYDRREFPVSFSGRERVDFWACDATALPFPPATIGGAVGLNTLDSVASPLGFLSSLAEVLSSEGKMILACPYDWTQGVTPVEAWIGGHSQRGSQGGASHLILADLLTPGAHPASIDGLRLLHQADDIRWKVRWHDRGMIDYRVHLIVAQRVKP